MNTEEYIDRKYLRENFSYDHDSGDLIWLHKARECFNNNQTFGMWNTRYAGKVAGCINPTDNYRYVNIKRNGSAKQYAVHRLVYIFHHGHIPAGFQVDHRDNDRLNNRIENLRLSTPSQNQHNRRTNSNSTTGVKNVRWVGKDSSYQVTVTLNGKSYNKMCKDWSLEDAAEYAANLRDRLHGEFARIA